MITCTQDEEEEDDFDDEEESRVKVAGTRSRPRADAEQDEGGPLDSNDEAEEATFQPKKRSRLAIVDESDDEN